MRPCQEQDKRFFDQLRKVPRIQKITADMCHKVPFKEHIESNYE